MPDPKTKRKPRVQAGVDALTGKDSARSVRKGFTYDTDGVVRPQATPRRENTAEESARAGGRWGKIRSKVEESKAFNEGTTPSKSPLESDRTTTAGGAWLASQVDSKEKIGSVDDYMGSRDDDESLQSKHLKKFLDGAHAFITVDIHKKIFSLNEDEKENWGNWGRDANFVAPLGDADKLVKEASAPGGRGIFHLEEKLGIPHRSWVDACGPSFSIYRYIVRDPKALNLRIPSGSESGAYGSWWKHDKESGADEFIAGQWQPKGSTDGGAAEAVIDAMSLEKLEKLKPSVIDVVEETSLAENTQRVLRELAAAPALKGPPAAAETPGASTPKSTPKGTDGTTAEPRK